MLPDQIKRLEHLCEIIPNLLRQFGEDEFIHKPAPGRWSKKEILGHLIDSAANNHQRFVRAQFEDIPTITYDQNKWNEYSHYNEIPGEQLISFWAAYNLQVAELVKHIRPDKLNRECRMGGTSPVTLEYVFDDYLKHLEHHLHQILERY